MDRATEILKYIAKSNAVQTMILAPNAPPLTKGLAGLGCPMSMVLDPSDVSDTLMGLHSLTPGAGAATQVMISGLESRPKMISQSDDQQTLGASGCFVFGVRDVGRVRVAYTTQRGSKVVSITRVPFGIPALQTLTDDVSTTDRLRAFVNVQTGGLVTISGPSAIANALLAYSLLAHVNKTTRQILYVIERSLTFLMGHD